MNGSKVTIIKKCKKLVRNEYKTNKPHLVGENEIQSGTILLLHDRFRLASVYLEFKCYNFGHFVFVSTFCFYFNLFCFRLSYVFFSVLIAFDFGLSRSLCQIPFLSQGCLRSICSQVCL